MTQLRAMFFTALAVSLVLPSAVAAQARSQRRVDYAEPGVYLGIGGTWATYVFLEDSLQAALVALGYTGEIEVDDPIGFNLRAGYRWHPHFAGEVEFEYLPPADITLNGSKVDDTRAWVITANVKSYLATGRLQPFTLIGLGGGGGSFDTGTSEAAFEARFGGGLEFYVTEDVAFVIDATYLLGTGDVAGIDYFSLGWGALYRF